MKKLYIFFLLLLGAGLVSYEANAQSTVRQDALSNNGGTFGGPITCSTCSVDTPNNATDGRDGTFSILNMASVSAGDSVEETLLFTGGGGCTNDSIYLVLENGLVTTGSNIPLDGLTSQTLNGTTPNADTKTISNILSADNTAVIVIHKAGGQFDRIRIKLKNNSASPIRKLRIYYGYLYRKKLKIVGDTTLCTGNSTTLTASYPGLVASTFKWYSAATGGTLLTTGASYTTPNLSATTTYYVEYCPGSYRDPVRVRVNPLPTQPAAASTTICSGTSALLNVNPISAGVTFYRWYDAAGVLKATGSNYTTDVLTTTTFYNVEGVVVVSGDTCTSPLRRVDVTVNPVATANAGTPQSVCAGGTITLEGIIGGSASTLTWSASSGTFSNVNASSSTYTPSITSGIII